MPIPPLRECGNDVLLLAGNFLELNRARLSFRSLCLSAAAEQLYEPSARGAVRTEIVTLEPEHLVLDATVAVAAKTEQTLLQQAEYDEQVVSIKVAVDGYQRQVIRQMLEACKGNWANVARRLELDSSNLHKLAKRLGLK